MDLSHTVNSGSNTETHHRSKHHSLNHSITHSLTQSINQSITHSLTFSPRHIALYFQGAFQFSEIYLNGEHVQDHNVGYTSFSVRLDNMSSILYDDHRHGDDGDLDASTTNVLAIRVDPTFGSGHWYIALAPLTHSHTHIHSFTHSLTH